MTPVPAGRRWDSTMALTLFLYIVRFCPAEAFLDLVSNFVRIGSTVALAIPQIGGAVALPLSSLKIALDSLKASQPGVSPSIHMLVRFLLKFASMKATLHQFMDAVDQFLPLMECLCKWIRSQVDRIKEPLTVRIEVGPTCCTDTLWSDLHRQDEKRKRKLAELEQARRPFPPLSGRGPESSTDLHEAISQRLRGSLRSPLHGNSPATYLPYPSDQRLMIQRERLGTNPVIPCLGWYQAGAHKKKCAGGWVSLTDSDGTKGHRNSTD